MTKEQILALLKDSILTLRDKGRTFHENEPLLKAWTKQNEMIEEAVKGLNSCDMLFINDEYSKWMKDTFGDYINKLKELNINSNANSEWL